jgi:hypothetical protein
VRLCRTPFGRHASARNRQAPPSPKALPSLGVDEFAPTWQTDRMWHRFATLWLPTLDTFRTFASQS